VPFFLTRTFGEVQNDQPTLTAGLIWWWGNKQGTW
jgi:hypothetical protein